MPPVLVPGFTVISEMDVEQRKELLNIVNGLEIGVEPEELESIIADKVGITEVKADQVSSVIFSLAGIEEELSDTPNLNIKDLISAITAINSLNADDVFIVYVKSLIKACDIDVLNITKKARGLLMERSNVLANVDLFTDVRPIFGGEENLEIKAVTIHYNLNISYQQSVNDRDLKNLTFAINEKDLKNLKEKISRAEKKAISINKKFNQVPIVK